MNESWKRCRVFALSCISVSGMKLIVVASPKTLGELRHHYHKETQSRLLAEIPKDLAQQPVDRIEAALVAFEAR